MPKLYFVFEQVSNGTSYTPIWDLKAIYDNVHYEIFCEELQDKARCAVDKAYAGNATALKEKILPRPIYPENLEQKLKQMKKQSNEYRLAGDFDAFISINHEIRQLNKLRKDKIAYERSVGNYERARKQAAAVNNKYKEAIIMEYNKLLDRFVVVSSNVDFVSVDSMVANVSDDNIRLNIYCDMAWPYDIVHVNFDRKFNINDYPVFIKFMKQKHQNQERAEDALRHAKKHYNARKKMLDDCKSDRDTLDFKKTFKLAVSAYYQVEGAERQLQNIYENSAREEARVREAFKKQCVSVVTPVNKSYLVERAIVSRLFRTHEVFKFGARERLPAYPD